jgi:kumamolisin
VLALLLGLNAQLLTSNTVAAASVTLPANLQSVDYGSTDLSKQVTIDHKDSKLGAVNTSQTLQLTIALKERDSAAFTQFLGDLYNPSSAQFHKFLSPAEYANRFGPTAEARQQVIGWLQSQGFAVVNSNPNGSTISVKGSVAQAQTAFHVEINNYSRADGSQYFATDRTAAFPASLSDKVHGVVGLSTALQMRPNAKPALDPRGVTPRRGPNDSGYSPTEFRNVYGVPASYTGAGTKIAVFELAGYNPANIATFNAGYGLTPPAMQDIPVDATSCLENDLGAGGGGQGEAELDVEIAQGLAPQATILFYCAPNSNFYSTIDEYQRIATDNLADILTISWGQDEVNFINEGLTSVLEAENNI